MRFKIYRTMIPIFIIFLLALPFVFADTEISNPRTVSEVSSEITETGTVYITSGSIDWININQTIPQSNPPFQDAYTDTPIAVDSLGNEIGYIYLEDPPLSIDYTIVTDVVSRSTRTLRIPDYYTIPDDVKMFLEPTEHIQSDDKRIISLASEITSDSASDFEKVALLAIWVNDNLDYDIRYSDVAKDALWILDNRVGVCSEYTTLFTALARASDIPARYVSAQAYGENGWEPHAYSEVYIGKWIPVDPLWLEVGYLDGTHIRYTVQEDNVVINNVKAYGSDIGDIVWTDSATDIDVRSVEYSDFLSYDSIYYPENLEIGDDVFVFAEITGPDYRVERFSLEPCTGNIRPVTIDDKEKIVLMGTGRKSFVVWTGHVSENLNPKMLYTCPLVINSAFFEPVSLPVKIASQEKNSVEISASLGMSNINIGDTQTIYATIRRVAGTDPFDIYFIADGMMAKKRLDVLPGEDIYLQQSFDVEGIGSKDVYIFSSTGDTSKLSYNAGDPGLVRIGDIDMPSALKVNTLFSAKIRIINDKAVPLSVKLHVNDDIQSIVVDDFFEKTVDIDTSTLGVRKLNVRITDGTDVLDEINKDVVVYDIPEVTVEPEAVSVEGICRISVGSSVDSARDVEVRIGDEVETISILSGQKELEFSLLPGQYDGYLVYYDASGDVYEVSFSVDVSEECIISRILRFLSDLIKSFV